MGRIVSAMTAASFLLALSACGGDKAEEPTDGDGGTPNPTVCNSKTTLGTVRLDIAGNANDSFRIIMKCGTQEVTRCTATVAAGQATASCTNQGPVPNGGNRSCTVGPGNGNSAAARVTAQMCG